MSSGLALEPPFENAVDPARRYLTTIDGCPLLWDDRDGCPVWPDGEPERVTYEPDGLITIEPCYDVARAWWGLPGKRLDCGHVVAAPEAYVTRLADCQDQCLACVGGR